MIICDLCGEQKRCRPRQLEGKEYDLCSDCWNPLAQKLKGKGRAPKERETVFLPPPVIQAPEPAKEIKPVPGEPPKIWSRAGKALH
jgi:hypothetical protein